jgi:hypothetical protein
MLLLRIIAFKLLGRTSLASLASSRNLILASGTLWNGSSFGWSLWLGFSILAISTLLVLDVGAIVTSTLLSLELGFLLRVSGWTFGCLIRRLTIFHSVLCLGYLGTLVSAEIVL